jgi:hypothetical protein
MPGRDEVALHAFNARQHIVGDEHRVGAGSFCDGNGHGRPLDVARIAEARVGGPERQSAQLRAVRRRAVDDVGDVAQLDRAAAVTADHRAANVVGIGDETVDEQFFALPGPHHAAQRYGDVASGKLRAHLVERDAEGLHAIGI